MTLPADVVALSNLYLREARMHLLQTFAGRGDASLDLVGTRAAILKAAQGMSAKQRDLAMNHATVRLQQMAYEPAVDTEPALEGLLEAARRHGADSDPDHEVGDLQDLLREAWKHLSPISRSLLLVSPAASQVVEGAIGEPLPTSALDIRDDEWAAVCKHYDLDPNCRYTSEQMLEYTNMYRLRAMTPPARYLSGHWEHIFQEDSFLPGARSSYLRFVYDRDVGGIVALQIRHRGEWADAKADAIADVEDSLKNANEDALQNPDNWGLSASDELPGWAVQSERQVERERVVS